MTTQHTPGPWRYEQRGTQIWARSIGGCQLKENDHLVADVRGWGHLQYLPNGADIQDANGRLIAAAPELLEACKKALYAIKGREHDGFLRAAIAKAEGGAA